MHSLFKREREMNLRFFKTFDSKKHNYINTKRCLNKLISSWIGQNWYYLKYFFLN